MAYRQPPCSPRVRLCKRPWLAGVGCDRLNDDLAHQRQSSFPPPAPVEARGAGGAGPSVPGTGLDAAMGDRPDGDEEADDTVERLLELSKQARAGKATSKKKEEKPRKETKKTSGNLGNILASRAYSKAEASDRSRSRKKEKDRKSGEEIRKLKSRPIGEVSDTEDVSSQSSEDIPDFRKASSREVDLVALSKRHPGCLLRSALKEMTRYLAARGEAEAEDPGQGRVLGYLHQILLPSFQRPESALSGS